MEGGPKSLKSGLKGAAAPGTEPDGEGTLPAVTGAGEGGQSGTGTSLPGGVPKPPLPRSDSPDSFQRLSFHSRRLSFRGRPPPPAPHQPRTRDHAHFAGKHTEARGVAEVTGPELQHSGPSSFRDRDRPGRRTRTELDPHLSGLGCRAQGCWSPGCCWGRGRWVCRTSPTLGCGGRRPAAPPGLAAWPLSCALIGRRAARP